MPKGKLKVLHPSYYTKFACIGGACEDTCCRGGWRITIDKATYQKYRKLKDPAFAKSFSDHIRRSKGENVSDKDYAYFVLDENGGCKFFREDGLCGIQAAHGADYLCATCKMYPRIPNYVLKDMIELSLYMTCPEAIRVALFAEEPMGFEISELEMDSRDPMLDNDQIGRIHPAIPLAQFLWPIRESAIDIMQCRSLTIAQRLFAIGMMLDKVLKLEQEGQTDKVAATLQAYVDAAGEGKLSIDLGELEAGETAAADLQGGLIDAAIELSNVGNREKAYYEFVVVIRDWLVADRRMELSYQEVRARIKPLTDKHWTAFLRERGHVIENYFVNYMFSSLFPFRKAPVLGVWQNYLMMVIQYALMRLMLSVGAGENGSITDDMLLSVITAMSNDIQHGSTAEVISNRYRKEEVATLAHLAFLLRD